MNESKQQSKQKRETQKISKTRETWEINVVQKYKQIKTKQNKTKPE